MSSGFVPRKPSPEELANPFPSNGGPSAAPLKWAVWEALRHYPAGLTAAELLEQMEARGLRSFKGRKNPSGQLAGDLVRHSEFEKFPSVHPGPRSAATWGLRCFLPEKYQKPEGGAMAGPDSSMGMADQARMQHLGMPSAGSHALHLGYSGGGGMGLYNAAGSSAHEGMVHDPWGPAKKQKTVALNPGKASRPAAPGKRSGQAYGRHMVAGGRRGGRGRGPEEPALTQFRGEQLVGLRCEIWSNETDSNRSGQVLGYNAKHGLFQVLYWHGTVPGGFDFGMRFFQYQVVREGGKQVVRVTRSAVIPELSLPPDLPMVSNDEFKRLAKIVHDEETPLMELMVERKALHLVPDTAASASQHYSSWQQPARAPLPRSAPGPTASAASRPQEMAPALMAGPSLTISPGPVLVQSSRSPSHAQPSAFTAPAPFSAPPLAPPTLNPDRHVARPRLNLNSTPELDPMSDAAAGPSHRSHAAHGLSRGLGDAPTRPLQPQPQPPASSSRGGGGVSRPTPHRLPSAAASQPGRHSALLNSILPPSAASHLQAEKSALENLAELATMEMPASPAVLPGSTGSPPTWPPATARMAADLAAQLQRSRSPLAAAALPQAGARKLPPALHPLSDAAASRALGLGGPVSSEALLSLLHGKAQSSSPDHTAPRPTQRRSSLQQAGEGAAPGPSNGGLALPPRLAEQGRPASDLGARPIHPTPTSGMRLPLQINQHGPPRSLHWPT